MSITDYAVSPREQARAQVRVQEREHARAQVRVQDREPVRAPEREQAPPAREQAPPVRVCDSCGRPALALDKQEYTPQRARLVVEKGLCVCPPREGSLL